VSTIAWWAAGLVGLAAIIWLASKWGGAKRDAVAADHMAEAIENAAKMRRTAEDGVRAAGDGTAGSLLGEWNRD
jgi:hypothetical protein